MGVQRPGKGPSRLRTGGLAVILRCSSWLWRALFPSLAADPSDPQFSWRSGIPFLSLPSDHGRPGPFNVTNLSSVHRAADRVVQIVSGWRILGDVCTKGLAVGPAQFSSREAEWFSISSVFLRNNIYQPFEHIFLKPEMAALSSPRGAGERPPPSNKEHKQSPRVDEASLSEEKGRSWGVLQSDLIRKAPKKWIILAFCGYVHRKCKMP